MSKKALFIGNSDGIGFESTKQLLDSGWSVTGISRSDSPIDDDSYTHHVAQVQDADYSKLLEKVLDDLNGVDLCVYCAGIGELLDPTDMRGEVEIFDVNLTGMVKTVSCVIPRMVANGGGRFIGLSSMADDMLSPEAPSYHASKAGFTCYLESLGLALKDKGVRVTNLRFGFVDTKMAKGDVRPFMMSVEKAVGHLFKCIDKKPIRYTAPWIVIPLIKLRKWMLNLSVLFG